MTSEVDAKDEEAEQEQEEEEEVSPYHAFTIGTVRFIVSDLRSEASGTSIYSPKQRSWIFNDISDAPSYNFVVWMTTKPWIGPLDPTGDGWAGFEDDQSEL